MTEPLNKIETARIRAAEDVVIAGIPAELLENVRRADERFAASGGCPGCKCQIIGVHDGNCPTLDEPDFY